MKCIECNKDASEVVLYRTVPKGEINTEWRCEDCIDLRHPAIHPDAKEVATILLNGNKA